MKKIIFKNGKHETNYRIQIQLIPEHLQKNKEIQAAIYLVVLIDSQSAGAAKYIFRFVKKSLPAEFFDNPDHEQVAKALALQFFEASYYALEEEWSIYFFEAANLDLMTILGRDKKDLSDYLLSEVKKTIASF